MEGLNSTLYKQGSLDVIMKQVYFISLVFVQRSSFLLPLDDNTAMPITFPFILQVIKSSMIMLSQ